MNDPSRTYQELIDEISDLKKRIHELEKSELDRNLMEEALRESEERFQMVSKAANDAIYDFDLESGTAWLSAAHDLLFGVSADHADFTWWSSHIHPEDRDRVLSGMHEAMEHGVDAWMDEYRFRRADGRYIDVLDRGYIHRDKKGIAVRLVGSMMDMSERKLAEAALLAEKKFSQSILNSMPGIFYCFDEQLKFKYWNINLERVSGYSSQEISKMSPLDFFTGEGQQFIEDAVGEVFTEGESSIETDIISKNGHRTPYLLTGFRVTIDNAVHLIGVGIDVSSRKQAEKALEQSRRNFQTFFNTINDFLYVLDGSGSIVHVNSTVIRRLGYSEAELVGQTVLIVHPPDRREEAAKIVAEMLEEKTSSCFIPVMTKDGRLIAVETMVTRGNWNGKPAIFGVSKDISQLKQSEEKFSKAFQSSSVLMILSSMDDGRFFDVNKTFLTTMGFSSEEVIGKTSIELGIYVDLKDRAKIRRLVKEKGEARNIEIKLRTRYGRILDGLLSADTVKINESTFLLSVISDITERKQAEEALGKSEERFQMVSKAANDAIYDFDLESGTAWLSAAHDLLFGVSADHADFTWWSSHIHPEDRDRVLSGMHEAMEHGVDAWMYEYRFRRADGQYVDILDRGHIHRDKKGIAVRLVGSMMDMTESKRAQEALRESENRYRLLAENATDVIWTVDMDMRLTYVSPSVTRLLGFTVEEAMARTMQQAYTPAAFEKAMQVFAEEMEIEAAGYFDPTRSRIVELEMVSKDGNTVTVEGNFCFLRDPAGKVIGILAIVRNIMDRKRLEEALRRNQEKYRTLLENLSTAVVVHGPDTTIEYSNPMASALLGIVADQMQGKSAMDPCWQFLQEDGRPLHIDEYPVNKVLSSGKQLKNMVTGILYPGHAEVKWVLCNAYPVYDEDVRILQVIVNFIDITERRQMEMDKEKLESQTRQLQKAESLGRMAGAIAHHFNNQIGAVIGNLELAMMELPKWERAHAKIAAAMEASTKAADMSGLMLTYLGQSFDERKPIDLSDTCLRSLTMLRAVMPLKVDLEYDFPSPGPIIIANANQMQQILTNLITNAWESLSEGQGIIRLSIKTVLPVEIPTSHCFPIGWHPQEHVYACLDVADTGCGITDNDIEKIFDPFFSRKFTGRGMGLAVVLGIVRAHGGAITVESELGQRSAFRVWLPLSDEQILRQPNKFDQTPEMEGDGTILLVEDEEMVRNMAVAMLKILGFQVLEANDGVEAVEVFKQHQDEIICVLSDLTMPRMNGWETLTALRKLTPNIPVILASGYDKAHVMAGDHPELPQVFLSKPYKLKMLSDAISQALGSGKGEMTSPCFTPRYKDN